MGRDVLYEGQGVGDMLFKRACESIKNASMPIAVALIVVDAKHG